MLDKTKSGTEEAAQIGVNKLKRLLKDADKAYKEGRAAAGEIGKKIATAAEHDHLHVKAFSTLRQMDRMTPEKCAAYWDALLYYVEVSGIEDKIKSAPRLALEKSEETEEE